MNKKAAISRELDAKHVKILEGLLKLPENRECADCKNKAPRWASINLGIFICLQCSGIHRSLGVHISKVRSATLDTWLPEQVVFMQRIGNEKANAYWEAELPDNYNRSQFENFIRAKYVDKLWVPRDGKLKSSPTSEGKLPSSPSSRSDSSSSITEFLANQKLEIKKIALVEKQASSKEEPASAHSLENTTTNQRAERKECLIAGNREADHGNAEVLKYDAKDQTPEAGPDPGSQKDVQSTKPAVTRDYSDKPNVVPVIPSPKIDYGTELFRLLCVDDFAESDCSPSSDASTWVDFDTDEEDTTLGKVVGRSLASKVHPEPKIDDVRTSIVSEIKKIPQEHQKDATYHNQGNLEELKKASVTSQDGSSLTNTTGITTYHGSFNGINNFPGTHLQKLNIPPPKFAAYTIPHTTSSLNKPAVPLSGLSKTPTKMHPTALPVSGFDYDFSFLTQGMFTK